MNAPAPLTHAADTLQSLALALLPHGGQRSARRNAWASMSSDAARARSRREAEEVMGLAAARAAAREVATAQREAARAH